MVVEHRHRAVTLGPGGTLGDLAVFAAADESLPYLRSKLGPPDSDSK
ncbi:hypothetical protein [Geodermatophilus obscurus]|nr:hypothetical protein [Geodermatophilus obscurus]